MCDEIHILEKNLIRFCVKKRLKKIWQIKAKNTECPISLSDLIQIGLPIVLTTNENVAYDPFALRDYWFASNTFFDPLTLQTVSCIDVWVISFITDCPALISMMRCMMEQNNALIMIDYCALESNPLFSVTECVHTISVHNFLEILLLLVSYKPLVMRQWVDMLICSFGLMSNMPSKARVFQFLLIELKEHLVHLCDV